MAELVEPDKDSFKIKKIYKMRITEILMNQNSWYHGDFVFVRRQSEDMSVLAQNYSSANANYVGYANTEQSHEA